MPETIYVRGEGGSIIAMDLPLPEGIQQRYDRGQLVRVNPDGTPYSSPPAAAPDPDGPAPESGPAPDGGDRPAQAAPKAEWIAYVARRGLLSADDAANYTKADLIDLIELSS
ncbi:hypothetical protein BJP40_19845 [Streptomyces sp. CC53]|uniref:hypothetical protein n=1 Tax=Streptomyces sp. CC53 TaxID=1906740 RepID=UPI0008DD26BE|nr:hypothetical protein [Streptomyces sp. CC53]OII64595.1 hypothetical protein BJP40_19845 [Streptomyces sp. CC53]